jgi:hypothetical protein
MSSLDVRINLQRVAINIYTINQWPLPWLQALQATKYCLTIGFLGLWCDLEHGVGTVCLVIILEDVMNKITAYRKMDTNQLNS